MKKIIFLLTLPLALINVSCAILGHHSANGICTCTCEACRNCLHKLSPEQLAHYQASQDSLSAEEARKRAELDSLLNMDYTIVHYEIETPQEPQPFKWEPEEVIDADINVLSPLFRTHNVNQSSGYAEYVYKNVNTSFKDNDTYFYFTTVNGVAQSLHFVVHFYADDPVNFVSLRISADNFKYEFTPTNITHTRDGAFYVENFDNVVDAKSKDVVAALAHCSYANMVMVSDGGVNHRIFFTPENLKRFRDTYNLFRLMGGKID